MALVAVRGAVRGDHVQALNRRQKTSNDSNAATGRPLRLKAAGGAAACCVFVARWISGFDPCLAGIFPTCSSCLPASPTSFHGCLNLHSCQRFRLYLPDTRQTGTPSRRDFEIVFAFAVWFPQWREREEEKGLSRACLQAGPMLPVLSES